MRTVVFSNEEVAREMNERFVCAWVNKAPKAGFPDGLYREMTPEQYLRFPAGAGVTNVTSIFSTADGLVLSAVPGYLDVESFRGEARFASDLWSRMADASGRLRREARAYYTGWHQFHAGRAGFVPAAHRRLAKAGLLPLDRITPAYFDDFAPPWR
jgi:hypothetical protein